MFESMMGRGEPRRVAHPVLSFALHAGLIVLAVGRPDPPGGAIVDPGPEVIHLPDGPVPPPQVDRGQATPEVPGVIECRCEVRLPEPLVPMAPGRLDESPRAPLVSNLIGAPGPVDPEPGQAGGVFQEGDLTDSPRIVHFPDPRYPPALREIGMEGAVQLAYVVDTLGVVEPGSVTVVSSDHPLMTDAVRLALAGARYLPGRNRGQPVRTQVRQTVRFSLMSL